MKIYKSLALLSLTITTLSCGEDSTTVTPKAATPEVVAGSDLVRGAYSFTSFGCWNEGHSISGSNRFSEFNALTESIRSGFEFVLRSDNVLIFDDAVFFAELNAGAPSTCVIQRKAKVSFPQAGKMMIDEIASSQCQNCSATECQAGQSLDASFRGQSMDYRRSDSGLEFNFFASTENECGGASGQDGAIAVKLQLP